MKPQNKRLRYWGRDPRGKYKPEELPAGVGWYDDQGNYLPLSLPTGDYKRQKPIDQPDPITNIAAWIVFGPIIAIGVTLILLILVHEALL